MVDVVSLKIGVIKHYVGPRIIDRFLHTTIPELPNIMVLEPCNYSYTLRVM